MARNRRRRPAPSTSETSARRGAGGLRGAVERRSAVPLVALHRLPRWGLPAVLAGLLIAGLALRGVVGGVVLLALTLFMGWLAYLSWPFLDVRSRLLRVLALVVLAGLAVARSIT